MLGEGTENMDNSEYKYECSECGSIVSPDDTVCKYCGSELHEPGKEIELEDRVNDDTYATPYITKKELVDLADAYFSSVLIHFPERTFRSLYCGQYLKGDKIENARRAYADYDYEKERVLILFDSTFFRSAEKGFLMTDTNIYYAEKDPFEKMKHGKYPISSIMTIEVCRAISGFSIQINGKILLNLAIMSSKEAKVLHGFFKKISARNIEELKKDSEKNKEIQNELIKKVSNYIIEGEKVLYLIA